MMTLTGDKIIHDIFNINMVLLLMAVGPHGNIESFFELFLYSTEITKPPYFISNQIHGPAAWQVTSSNVIQKGLLIHTDTLWRLTNPGQYNDRSYNCIDHMTYLDQQLGLTISTALSGQLISAHWKIKKSDLQEMPLEGGNPLCVGEDALVLGCRPCVLF